MAKLNIPTKVPTSTFTAGEVNLIVTAINEVDVTAKEPSHAFSSEDFKQVGTTTIGGKVIPVIEINPTSPRLVFDGVTSVQLATALSGKANKVGGLVPLSELPTFYFDTNDFEGDGTLANPFKLKA